MKWLFVVWACVLTLCEAPAQQPRQEPEKGMFVAVGYGGRRITSRDGFTWENDQRWSDEARDNDDVLFNIACGAGRFIAVGGGAMVGRILSTRDGREWRELQRVKGRVATISFGNGRFVASHDAELMFSTDGEVFHPGQRLEWKGSVHARRSACGDTEAGFRFVVIGDVDLWAEGKRVHWRGATGSGARWDHAALDTPAARDIAYGAGHFVVVGADGLIESSHDGQTWQRHSTSPGEEFSRVVWTGTRFLASGGKAVWASPDALTWSKEPVSAPGGFSWVREGPATLGLALSWNGLHVSADLAHWKKAILPPGPPLQAVTFGPVPRP